MSRLKRGHRTPTKLGRVCSVDCRGLFLLATHKIELGQPNNQTLLLSRQRALHTNTWSAITFWSFSVMRAEQRWVFVTTKRPQQFSQKLELWSTKGSWLNSAITLLSREISFDPFFEFHQRFGDTGVEPNHWRRGSNFHHLPNHWHVFMNSLLLLITWLLDP